LGGEDDLVRLLARVKALQAFVETAEGADLLAGLQAGFEHPEEGGLHSLSPFRGEWERRSA
jgi:glycyl-tRNA synthetase beta chain